MRICYAHSVQNLTWLGVWVCEVTPRTPTLGPPLAHVCARGPASKLGNLGSGLGYLEAGLVACPLFTWVPERQHRLYVLLRQLVER